MSITISLLLAMAVPPTGEALKPAPAAPVDAKPVPAGKVSTANPRSIVAYLQKDGYRAKLVTDDGDPYVESATSGATFNIKLLNCKEKRDCQDVMFQSSYDKRADKPVKIEQMNDYNRENRWGRAYLDKDGGPVVEYDVLFTDQLIDEKAFDEALDIWNSVLSQFHKTIDWR